MGVARMLRSWRARVQAAWPDLHGHQIKALADASFAMAQAEHCQLSHMALVTPGQAKVPSHERRFQRLLANDRLSTAELSEAWAEQVLAEPGPLMLGCDETPQGDRLRAMKLSRLVRGRAVPLLWQVYPPEALPKSQPDIVLDLLRRADRLLPADGPRPTLLTDRGLTWPEVVDFCIEHGWHFVLRVQDHTRVKLEADGPTMPMAELAPHKGDGWCGAAWVFKKAGWRRVNPVAWWPHDSDERWLIITDRPPTLQRCMEYRKRMQQEQSFRDEKSHGFNWKLSRVRRPDHADRLLLIMAVAMTLLIQLGQWVIRHHRRDQFERRDRYTLSIFQLGLRALQRSLITGRPPPI